MTAYEPYAATILFLGGKGSLSVFQKESSASVGEGIEPAAANTPQLNWCFIEIA